MVLTSKPPRPPYPEKQVALCPNTGFALGVLFLGTMSHYWKLLRGMLTIVLRSKFYFRKQKFLRTLGDTIVPSMDSFGGHWRPEGVKLHIFVHQGKPSQVVNMTELLLTRIYTTTIHDTI